MSRVPNCSLPPLTAKQISRFNLSFLIDKGCWLWTGYIDGAGRARFKYNNHRFLASRVAYFLATGIDAGKLNVHHTCDNPRCIKFNHLWLGTQRENIEDMNRKGRHGHTGAKGIKQPTAKLTDEKVREIRLKLKNQPYLAKKFRVSQSLISMVQNRQVWKHVQ